MEARSSLRTLRRVVGWYFEEVYGQAEGPGTTPFYCDPSRIGHFAVDAGELAAGKEAALFRLFVALSMYQARRDVVIMEQQLAMSRTGANALASASLIGSRVTQSSCGRLTSPSAFDAGCSVWKSVRDVDCDEHAGEPCHVKEATRLLQRMGDMGKLPTSAWLHAWRDGGISRVLAEVLSAEADAQRRADLLVERFAKIYRVGVKLATMYVSALSTPSLAPGLTPWFPTMDGSALVVVDTNVARAVDLLGGRRRAKTYDSYVEWVRAHAALIDLSCFGANVRSYSPRLVQQALYAFCSKSNRIARGDHCSRGGECPAPRVCPFAAESKDDRLDLNNSERLA
jgi:hypothetical protein